MICIERQPCNNGYPSLCCRLGKRSEGRYLMRCEGRGGEITLAATFRFKQGKIHTQRVVFFFQDKIQMLGGI